MVGVPGRSKACQQCKRRKIACDLQKPRCGQCVKAMYRCSSSSGFIFVPNQSGSHKTIYNKSLNATSSGANASTSVTTTLIPSFNDAHALASMVLSLPKEVPTSALNRQQVFASFSAPESTEVSWLHSWTTKFANPGHSTPDMISSPLACFTAFLGRRDKDQQLVAASRQLYARGLWDVRKALRDHEAALRNDTLGACLSLTMYEALECPDSSMDGYFWHSQGCSRLIELRGPGRHADGLGHDLFLEFRLHGAADALRLHKPNYLSTSAWMTLPWRNKPKNLFHKLLDIFLLGPAILQKGDLYPLTPPEHIFPLISSIADDLWTIEIKLEEFYKELQDHYSGHLYTEKPAASTVILNEGEDTFRTWRTTCLHFPSLEVARILSLFWSIQAMTWNGLRDLDKGAREMGIAGMLPAIGHRANFLEPVRRILQSVEWWNSAAALSYGPARIALSLNIIIDTMEGKPDCEEEQAEAWRWQKEIGQSMLRMIKYSNVVNPWVLRS